jgi:hypothetical protein
MAEDGTVKDEVTRTTGCRARACSGENVRESLESVECSTSTADSMPRASLAGAATVSRLEPFELLQVHHYRCCMLPRCLHASNGWRRES